MVYSLSGMRGARAQRAQGPLRVGAFYGALGVAVAAVEGFALFLLDPRATSAWLLAALTDFLPLLALAAYILLAALAALRVRPVRLEPGVPYRPQLMRDAALAAAVVGVMVGLAALVLTGLQATLFADEIRAFAREAAPRIAAYVEETRRELSDPPPPVSAGQVERLLQPPSPGDLGRVLGNAALGTIFLGALGALIGALRGRFGGEPAAKEEERSP